MLSPVSLVSVHISVEFKKKMPIEFFKKMTLESLPTEYSFFECLCIEVRGQSLKQKQINFIPILVINNLL